MEEKEKLKRSRKLREGYPNAMYHITSRGNRRNDIFRDEEDYKVYMTILKEAVEFLDNQYEIICYCLMTNHIHLQVQTKEKHIKCLMSFSAKKSKSSSKHVRMTRRPSTPKSHQYKKGWTLFRQYQRAWRH